MSKESLKWWNYKPRAGFRFSCWDSIAIAVCLLATWGLWSWIGILAMVFPVVLFHFFLFCNVFRIPRNAELVWAAAFIAKFAFWQFKYIGDLSWLLVLWRQLPITIAVLLYGILRKDYHGIGYSLLPWVKKYDSADT